MNTHTHPVNPELIKGHNTKKINKKNLILLFAAAMSIRLIVFFGYIQKHEYYKQPDSSDYHFGAISTGLGYGMVRLDNGRPTYWRTPGYPLFLSCFYNFFGIKSLQFTDNWPAQTAAIIFQIILGALISILIFFLALLLTNSLCIAWATCLISALHPGFVLSDIYILTESLSIIFLIPFFIFFFKSLDFKSLNLQNSCSQSINSTNKKSNTKNKSGNFWLKNIIFAAIFLALFTWVRPMGQFVSVVAILIILLFDNIKFKIKLRKILIFLLIFFVLISPWYVRNYNITGKIFFCPMLGLYLNTFNAPKIVRATTGAPLLQCIQQLYSQANTLALEEYKLAKSQGLKDISTEIVHNKVAIPIILDHPFLFLKDWIKEVTKTTFDLYSYQLVAMAKNDFFADPVEEFLTEKWDSCLHDVRVPIGTRIIVYLEILFEFLKWLGLICGLFLFWIYPLIVWMFPKLNHTNPTTKFPATNHIATPTATSFASRLRDYNYIKKTGLLWLKVSPIIAAFVGMTGGFGYARLRLPVECLMVILSLTFWTWIFGCKNTRE